MSYSASHLRPVHALIVTICESMEAMPQLSVLGILDQIFLFALYTVCGSVAGILSPFPSTSSLSQLLKYGDLLPTLE